MQVSNSTGRNTDYRVGVSGGNTCFTAVSSDSGTATMIGGPLSPGDIALCLNSGPCTVEFTVDGQVISRDFTEDPGLVTLVETDGQYTIEVTPGANDGSVAF